MAGVEKLTIAVTPELRAMVTEAVQEGAYASTSEVVAKRCGIGRKSASASLKWYSSFGGFGTRALQAGLRNRSILRLSSGRAVVVSLRRGTPELTAKVSRHPKAEQDLVDIWRYIAGDSVTAADKLIQAIAEKCELLAEHPESGELELRLEQAFERLRSATMLSCTR